MDNPEKIVRDSWNEKYKELQLKLADDLGKASLNNSTELDLDSVVDSEALANGEIASDFNESEHLLIESIVPYLESVRLKSMDFRWIDARELAALQDLKQLKSGDNYQRNKALVVAQIYNNAQSRQDQKQSPQQALDQNQKSELKTLIKEQYIMPFNHYIRESIDSLPLKENYISKFETRIRRYYSHAMSSRQVQADLLGRTRQEINQKAQDDLNCLISLYNGMRHELAFRELLTEIDEQDLFRVLDVTPEDDAKGKDWFVAAKVTTNVNGDYIYPTQADIASNNFKNIIVPIDIKSNATEALTARKKQEARKSDSLTLWSHVYKKDFGLSYQDGVVEEEHHFAFRSMFLVTGANSALEAIKNLKGTGINRPDAKRRYQSIKNQIINWINTHPQLEAAPADQTDNLEGIYEARKNAHLQAIGITDFGY